IQLIFHSYQFEVEVHSCKNGDDCIEILRSRTFDLVILDVNLPDTDTFQLVGLILTMNPRQKILIFSMSSEEMYAKHFLKLGTVGFISKQASNDDFMRAVNTVLEGNIYLSSLMINAIAKDSFNSRKSHLFENLSSREFEVMSYFVKGYSSKEICNMTNLHSSTVGTYKYKIMDKLGVKNLIELEELAKIHGIK
nr:response regulator transcription factor [Saprospiraceae bacterium]